MTDSVQPRTPREKRKNLYIALTALFMVLYSASVALDFAIDANLFWFTAPLIIAAVGFACLWARALDEMQLQAHYVSWFWGGSLGLMASALVYLALFPTLQTPGAVDAMLPRGAGPLVASLSFHAGFVLGIMPAVIGYAIWWGVMKMRTA